ncbi:DEXDc helicase [Bodo saltans virus]|uniref:DEXDc helicase n=1 Tax=Bodo saltans virus TaxID=2024608 RepID=A0A2H4UTJ1_9VIRU|nr:DEXDc helicase [Bodo saltans virus]ATZ80252.1 DEXDc helicase [Bodo saltans virus]
MSDKKLHPSNEQEAIINSITAQKSVIVNAVAGSGKTTTLLFIAKNNKDKRILQITYNKQLKMEVREKLDSHGVNNVEVHTYHSLYVKTYDSNCFTDDYLIKVINEDKRPRYRPKYDIIAIDETQDMTPNYFECIYKFMQDIGFKGTILILGDCFQGVYDFKNADERFLLLSHKIWSKKFEHLTLNQSYRVTSNIASFVNKIMIGYDRIYSQKKSDEKVYYYRVNVNEYIEKLYEKIKDILKKYKPDDIFILSPSLKSSDNPSKKLENLMVKNNLPVYFTRNDEEGINDKIIANKIVFTTFHQAKGRERKVVIIFGFDDSYFELYARDKNKNKCPSELYVAVTRASEILILMEDTKHNQLPFLKKTPCIIRKYTFVDYIDDKHIIKKIKPKTEKKNYVHKTNVKELTMYLRETIVNELISLTNMLFVVSKQPLMDIKIPMTIETSKGLVEDVSDLNGIIIPAIYETMITKEDCSILKTIKTYTMNVANSNHILVNNKLMELKEYEFDFIKHYTLLGNIFIALSENIFSKLNQIDKYEWLTNEMIDNCIDQLKNNIGTNSKYEQTIYDNNKNYYALYHDMYGEINISGRIDVYDDDTLWELKCTNSLQLEHLLQLILYAWLWEKIMKKEHGSKKYKILNIRTGEIRELIYKDHLINEIIELLLINKYENKFKNNDEEFIEKCDNIKNKYMPFKDDILSMFDIEQ